ncbi:MAG: hypothetical protein K2R98_06835 [Gemmataceae bacterium]|nr:hypothetical protein [Gemmataceae bacterium]
MHTWVKRLALVTVVGAGLFATAGPAAAQFRYGNYGGYGNRFYNYGYNRGGFSPYGWGGWGNNFFSNADPYGGYLNGAANVINAQGQYLISSQTAFLKKEQVRSAQMDNRRKAFDEYMYEKANTPTLNEKRIAEQQAELTRALTNPPETEIWSAKSLNDMLQALQQLRTKELHGPTVPLNEGTLKQVNVTVRDVGNVGLLKDAGKLKWPFVLRGLSPKDDVKELRDQVDARMAEGKKQAMKGEVDADLLIELQRDVDKLRYMLKDAVANTSFNDYTAGKRYLNELDNAIKVLKDPDVEKYVNGTYAAQGKNVEELVAYMTQNGLRFSPAIRGEEGAYSALFQSMVQYYNGSNPALYSQGSPGEKSPR